MDNLKFIATLIVILAVVGAGGYWALNTIESGSQHVNSLKIKQLENENAELKQQIKKLSTADTSQQIAQAQNQTQTTPQTKPDTTPNKTTDTTTKPTSTKTTSTKTATTSTKTSSTKYKNQSLIDELQKLANAGVVLKLKSAGPSVGSVQKFLNVYNKASNKVDNDYGASTKTAVAAFQKAQGLTQSGEAGKSTFTKMVAWLKKQG